MASDDREDLGSSARTRRFRFEIRTVVAIACLVVVLGGVYVAVFGSPTRGRAAIDNTNTDPSRAQNVSSRR